MNLRKYRKDIDEIDTQIILLLKERFDIVKNISKHKRKCNVDILDKQREKEIIEEKLQLAQKYEINDDFVKVLFEIIFSESKKIQKELNI